MGLDMFLTARRRLRTWGGDDDVKLINELNAKFGLEPTKEDDFSNPISVKELTFEAAYWRKANAIHKWFVDNVQDGVDECQETFVAREQLRKLIDTCKAVLMDPHKAQELLPTESGFFFGGTEYDEWYYRDLEYTVERLEKVLATPVFEGCEFYYQSSW
jgi:hypothetical protein